MSNRTGWTISTSLYENIQKITKKNLYKNNVCIQQTFGFFRFIYWRMNNFHSFLCWLEQAG